MGYLVRVRCEHNNAKGLGSAEGLAHVGGDAGGLCAKWHLREAKNVPG